MSFWYDIKNKNYASNEKTRFSQLSVPLAIPVKSHSVSFSIV